MTTKSLGLGGLALPFLFGGLAKKSFLLKAIIFVGLFCWRLFFRRF